MNIPNNEDGDKLILAFSKIKTFYENINKYKVKNNNFNNLIDLIVQISQDLQKLSVSVKVIIECTINYSDPTIICSIDIINELQRTSKKTINNINDVISRINDITKSDNFKDIGLLIDIIKIMMSPINTILTDSIESVDETMKASLVRSETIAKLLDKTNTDLFFYVSRIPRKEDTCIIL